MLFFQSQFGRTALQLAVQKGNLPMFDLLLSHGANINHCTSVSKLIMKALCLNFRHDVVVQQN